MNYINTKPTSSSARRNGRQESSRSKSSSVRKLRKRTPRCSETWKERKELRMRRRERPLRRKNFWSECGSIRRRRQQRRMRESSSTIGHSPKCGGGRDRKRRSCQWHKGRAKKNQRKMEWSWSKRVSQTPRWSLPSKIGSGTVALESVWYSLTYFASSIRVP